MPKRRVDELKPNAFNALLFSASLAQESIGILAESMAVEGLKNPIRVTPSGIIVDGERRWRAAQLLGWELISVTITPEYEASDLLDQVIDAFTSTRSPSIEERVKIYENLVDRLKADSGLAWGGRKPRTSEGSSVSIEEVRNRASKLAGFSSVAQARRASLVFARGSSELKAQVLSGELAVSSAYATLGSDADSPEGKPAKDKPAKDKPAKDFVVQLEAVLEKAFTILQESDQVPTLVKSHVKPWVSRVAELQSRLAHTSRE